MHLMNYTSSTYTIFYASLTFKHIPEFPIFKAVLSERRIK